MEFQNGIKSLAKLLQQRESDSDSEEEMPNSTTAKLGPGFIGPPQQKESKCTSNAKSCTDMTGDRDIWSQEEVNDSSYLDITQDPREEPEYDMKYKQNVTTEDIFLQVGGKTPATASCEEVLVAIHLPGESLSSVDLEVTRTKLDVRSPRYRLSLHLPHPVDPKMGDAHWEKEAQKLVVTLRLKRELDFINF